VLQLPAAPWLTIPFTNVGVLGERTQARTDTFAGWSSAWLPALR